MRKAGLAFALVASAQLSLLSSPAFADDSATKASLTPTESEAAPAPVPEPPAAPAASDAPNPNKRKTGFILLGIGGAAAVAGLVLDIAGTQVGNVAGEMGTTTSNGRTNFYWGGTTLLVAGLVTGVVGGSMVLSNGADTKATPKDHTEEAHDDGITKTVQAAYQSAPSMIVPILGGRF